MLEQNRYKNIESVVGTANISINEPMSSHTTFRVGGMADAYVKVEDVQTLKELLKLLNEAGTDYYIVGNGSNLLVSDDGYRGVIISLTGSFEQITVRDNCIEAGAGALLGKVAAFALKSELTGLEFASGIPGTLGGGLVMNAGAYGGELKDVVTSVKVIDTQTGEVSVLDSEKMEFGYRHSILKERPFFALSAEMRLNKGKEDEIKSKMEDFNSRRREKQPLEYPSAGSTFKRPEGAFAGALIEGSNLKGYAVGGAMVSEKHAGFVINAGDATASDINRLIQDVQSIVKRDSGIELEPEVIKLGKFV